jgi:hypothetical protein
MPGFYVLNLVSMLLTLEQGMNSVYWIVRNTAIAA